MFLGLENCGPNLNDFLSVPAMRPVVEGSMQSTRYGVGTLAADQQQQSTVTDAAVAARSALSALSAAVNAIGETKQAVSRALGQVQSLSPAIPGAADALQSALGQIAGMEAAIPGARTAAQAFWSYYGPAVDGNFYAVQATPMTKSTADTSAASGIMAKANAMIEAANQIKNGIGAVVGAAQQQSQQARLDAASAARDAAAQAAAAQSVAQRTADQVVSSALLKSRALAGQGNFDGASAVLQNSSVVAAAQVAGRSGDIEAAMMEVSGYQGKAQKEQAATQAMRDACVAKGGNWTGQACDLSEVLEARRKQSVLEEEARRRQASAEESLRAQQVACNSSGGTWTKDNICDMALVIQSQRDRDAAAAQGRLAAQAASESAAAQARADVQARADAEAARAQAAQEFQFRQSQAQAEQERRAQLPALLEKLAPLFAAAPQTAQAILASLLGGGAQADMAAGVPGDFLSTGGAQQIPGGGITPSTVKYSEYSYGESF